MAATTRRAFVVAHYDPAGRVPRHLRELLAHLASSARVVFVSTGLDAHHALPQGVEVITRANEGYDFFSYKRGIEALGDLAAYDGLTIFNSSFVCVDPARLTQRFFARSRPHIDVLGLTANHEIAPHLQSYWISFEGRRALQSPAFSHWWTTMQPVSDKSQVILRYEVGMSHALESGGLKLGAAFAPTPQEKMRVAIRSSQASSDGLNPTHYFWDTLLEEFAIVKLELVRDNPFNLDLGPLRAALAARPQWRALVDDALAGP